MTNWNLWNLDAQARVKYSPDAALLQTRQAWFCFFYDGYIDPATFWRVAFSKEDYLAFRDESDTMVAVKATDSDPGVNRPEWADPNVPGFIPASRLKGNLHLLPTEAVISIDRDLQNGVEVWERRRIPLLIPTRRLCLGNGHRKFKTPFCDLQVYQASAWIWEGRRSHFEPQIEYGTYNLKPTLIRRPQSFWIGDFYTNERCPN